MGATFWTYFLGSMGAFCLLYMVVMTPVHMIRNARARRAAAAAPAVPDDKHVAFPEPVPVPALRVIRGGLDGS